MFMEMGGKLVSGRLTVYLPKDAVKQLETWAATEHRTLSNLAAALLLKALEEKNGTSTNQDQGAA